ncbi:MAG: hypothetical protein DI498_11025 [Paracoccus denitrificans]|nr:MAG: hypothetical protein DI498_11025 [Paracoccus denitrificans]PZO83671.1 MAG: hypothetical protein DI633_11025 [Paracoccus denitrificans]
MGIISAIPMMGGIQIIRALSDDDAQMSFVEPSDEGWLEALAAVEATAPDVEEPAHGPTLDAAKEAAINGINAVRGEVRRKFITVLPGQDMVYLEKETEARSWLNARAALAAGTGPEPDPMDYPHITREAGITAPDPDSVAQIYLNMAWQFRQISSVIEGVALEFIAAVEACDTPSDAFDVSEAFPATLAAAMSAAGAPL